MADPDYRRLSARACRLCKDEFQPKRIDAVFCSKKCGRNDWMARNPSKVSQWACRRQPSFCSYWAAYCLDCKQPYGRRRPWVKCPSCLESAAAIERSKATRLAAEAMHRAAARQTVCEECGTTFCPLYGSSNAVLCSCCAAIRLDAARRCSKAKRRALERGAHAEKVDPIKVFDRDNWRCRLCGIKTPRSKRGSYAENAPELDHILPLSKGGEHTYLNTQCACRRCNQAKSDRPMGQMLLIG